MKSMAMFACGFLLGSLLIGSRGTVLAGVKVLDDTPPQPAQPTQPAQPVQKAFSPFVIYGDDVSSVPYAPTGWMGNKGAIDFNDRCTESPHSGQTCAKVEYKADADWGGIVWQNPQNDWGDKPGGFNLTGATKITFWARGRDGGEKVEFYFGVIKSEKPFSDSDTGRIAVVLTKDWRQYTIDLTGKNLTRIKTGFGWSLAGQGKPVAFYLDDIQYE